MSASPENPGRRAWEQRLLEERARALAAPRTALGEEARNAERVLVCAVGDALFGLDMRRVLRVMPFRHPARLPSANAALLGLIARSGVYHRIFDLGVLLSGGAARDGGYFLLLRNSVAGLRVDQALNIAAVVPLNAEESPHGAASHPATRGYARPLQAGLFDGRLISLLDLDKLLADAAPSAHGGHRSVDL